MFSNYTTYNYYFYCCTNCKIRKISTTVNPNSQRSKIFQASVKLLVRKLKERHRLRIRQGSKNCSVRIIFEDVEVAGQNSELKEEPEPPTEVLEKSEIVKNPEIYPAVWVDKSEELMGAVGKRGTSKRSKWARDTLRQFRRKQKENRRVQEMLNKSLEEAGKSQASESAKRRAKIKILRKRLDKLKKRISAKRERRIVKYMRKAGTRLRESPRRLINEIPLRRSQRLIDLNAAPIRIVEVPDKYEEEQRRVEEALNNIINTEKTYVNWDKYGQFGKYEVVSEEEEEQYEPPVEEQKHYEPAGEEQEKPLFIRDEPEQRGEEVSQYNATMTETTNETAAGIRSLTIKAELDTSLFINNLAAKKKFDEILKENFSTERYNNLLKGKSVQLKVEGVTETKDADGETLEEVSRTFSVPFSKYGDLGNLNDTLWSRQLFGVMSEYKDYSCRSISLTIATPPDGVMGSGTGRSLKIANNCWNIVSPISTVNCVYQSLVILRDYENDLTILDDSDETQKRRVVAAKNLKLEIRNKYDILDGMADYESLQSACNYLRMPVRLFNNCFATIKLFTPDNPKKRIRSKTKVYELQKIGNHCKALVRKNLILKLDPEYKFEPVKKVTDTILREKCVLIPKPKNWDKKNFKIMSCDIETYQKGVDRKQTPYAFGMAYRGNLVEQDYIQPPRKKRKPKKKPPKKTPIKSKTAKKTPPKKTRKPRKVQVKPPVVRKRWIVENSEKLNYISFWGDDCIKQWETWFFERFEAFKGYTAYLHNGGKFDLPLMLEKCFVDSTCFNINTEKCFESNGSWISFEVTHCKNKNWLLRFRDSYRLLSVSLAKITKDCGVKHQKLTELVDHNDINQYTWKIHQSKIDLYLKHDCCGLLEVIEQMRDVTWENDRIDLTKCLTNASLAKAVLFKKYYNPSSCPLYALSDKIDSYIRKGYNGGRVEVYRMGHFSKHNGYSKIFYDDFTSLYPDVGRKVLPVGKPRRYDFTKDLSNTEAGFEYTDGHCTKLPRKFFGFVNCEMRHRPDEIERIDKRLKLPMTAFYRDKRLTFPILENWTLKEALFSEEIDYERYDYKFQTGYRFDKGYLMRRFFNDGFANKKIAKSKGQHGLAHTHKIKINSGYGMMGMNTKNRDGVVILGKGDPRVVEYLEEGKLQGFDDKGKYTFARVIKDIGGNKHSVAVASAITSYARMKETTFMEAIMEHGGEVLYCDTDSVISTLNVHNCEAIMQRFKPDGTGNALGSLKSEGDDLLTAQVRKGKITQKTLDRIREENAGNVPFTEVVITGLKQYAIKVKVDDQEFSINKLKGYQRKKGAEIQFEQLLEMSVGGELIQTQEQFRCPKNNYISATNAFSINVVPVTKHFRKIYTKGKEDTVTGIVRPFRI